MVIPPSKKALCCVHKLFFLKFFSLSPEKFLLIRGAAFVPHLSVSSCLTGIVPARSGSNHLRRVAHGRDFIENSRSLHPPVLHANLFETILCRASAAPWLS